MSNAITADEVLAIAERIERNGVAFYTRAAEHASAGALAELLQSLASMEEGHIRVFTGMRNALSPEERQEPPPESDPQALEFAKAVADAGIFGIGADPAGMLTGVETPEEVLRIALDLERNSIVYYQGIKDLVPERLGRHRVNEVIREEMSHVTVLSRRLAEL